ncbi:MAG: HD domain-containing phosphohydrolase [Desulfobulbus sp.]
MNGKKQTVLVVDDLPENIDVLVGTLRETYNVKAATNGRLALKIAMESPPDIILLDIMMPGIDGYEVCRRLKEEFRTRNIPIIFITAKIGVEDELRCFELGAVDFITKPISPPVVRARVKTHLALYDQNRELDRKVREQTGQLFETRLKIIQRLGKAVEFKDNETGLHVIRMSSYSLVLARAAGFSEQDAELLMHAAPMHDIGKIGIPDAILKKKGKLTTEEYDLMQTHCQIGAEVIGDDRSELLRLARVIALTHHERWNGQGYPARLAGENIPLPGRITAIADVFDALTSDRPYKQAWPMEKAVSLLEEEAGNHFDPNLVPLFLRSLDQIRAIHATYSEKNSSS